MRLLRRALALAPLLLVPSLAFAHPGHDGQEVTWDFASGLDHPLSGLDHALAMIAVGIWAASLRGRAIWIVPAAFAAVMAFGAAVGSTGRGFSGLEQGIAASIVVFGLLIAAGKRLPALAAASVVGVFALFHGMAHGLEIPANANFWGYAAGFVTGTVLLHCVGLGIGFLARNKPMAIRFAGAGVALAGLALAL